MPAVTATDDSLPVLLATLESSLPMYLADSGLSRYPGPEEIRAAVTDLVVDQRTVVARAMTVLESRELAVPRPAYPMSFTALHDIDLRHLVPRLVADLRRQADACTSIHAATAGNDAATADLAAEAAAASRRFLERVGRISPPVVAGSAPA